MLGLAPGSKNGYQLLKLSTGRTIVSHDVRFHPSNFPFQDAIEVKEQADVHEDLEEEFYKKDPDIYFPSSLNDDSEVLVDEDSSAATSSSPDPVEVKTAPETADINTFSSETAPLQDDAWDSSDEEPDSGPDEDDNMDASPDMFVQDHALFNKHQQISDEDLIYCLAATEDKPPASLGQALSGRDGKKWKEAMVSEIQSHLKNNTFTVSDVPHGVKTVGSTVVLRVKPGPDGKPGRFKARWVAQGFSQVPGVHFTDTFAPTPQQSVFRILLSIAVQHGLSLRQMDVAFLIPDLHCT